MTEQSLREFVMTNTLPARVKVTEGCYDVDHVDWEFSTGDVIDLNKIVCPNVSLSFIHPDTGDEKTVSVSTNSPCLFKIMPYIPDQPLTISRAMVINGVTNLVRIWPSVVCARSSLRDAKTNVALSKGDKLRLKRVFTRDGQYYLECSLTNSQLVLLPMQCDLEFLLVEDTTAYTLAEISDMQGRVERRLRLSEDLINKNEHIHGLPRDFVGDLIMAPPQRFVEVHPADSPGEQFVVPISIDITVADRPEDYSGLSWTWYKLEMFVGANCSKFPMVVSIANWEEEHATLQSIRASIGDRIVLHKVEQIMKVACEIGNSRYVIPLTYDAVFELKPQIFTSLKEVLTLEERKIKQLKVIGDGTSHMTGLDGVRRGDIIEILPKQNIASGTVNIRRNNQKETEKLPLDLRGKYEEMLVLAKGNRGTVSELDVDMLPLEVVFPDPSASIPPRRDCIPRGVPVRILFKFRDPCVRVSKNIERGLTVPVPLRTRINVRYISQYKTHARIPELSQLSSCPEEIIDENRFEDLRALITGYENTDSFPEVAPPKLPPKGGFAPGNFTQSFDTHARRQHGLLTTREGCPLPDVPMNVNSLGRSPSSQTHRVQQPSGLHRSISDPPPRIPPRAPKNVRMPAVTIGVSIPTNDDCVITNEIDYEDVADLRDYDSVFWDIFGDNGPPSVTTPADANVSRFSWAEMVVFLQLLGMPPQSLRLFARDKVDGKKFGKLSNSDLSDYGINYPIVRHFRDKSKATDPLKTKF